MAKASVDPFVAQSRPCDPRRVLRCLVLIGSGVLVACGSGASAPSNGPDGSTSADGGDAASTDISADDAADAGGATDAASDLGASSACTSTPVWNAAAVPSCASLDAGSARMHIRGTLAEQSVDVLVDTSGGYEYTADGGDFEAPYLGQPTTDLDVAMQWMPATLHPAGAPFPATGTIRMRPGDPLGGMTLCAGNGTQADFEWSAPDGGGTEDYLFHLACLTLGPDCAHPVSGEIWGCWSDGF